MEGQAFVVAFAFALGVALLDLAVSWPALHLPITPGKVVWPAVVVESRFDRRLLTALPFIVFLGAGALGLRVSWVLSVFLAFGALAAEQFALFAGRTALMASRAWSDERLAAEYAELERDPEDPERPPTRTP